MVEVRGVPGTGTSVITADVNDEYEIEDLVEGIRNDNPRIDGNVWSCVGKPSRMIYCLILSKFITDVRNLID
jgi:NAD(P)-dependent dehydrogenase (short-subunit alcohol dehydrogenase family)